MVISNYDIIKMLPKNKKRGRKPKKQNKRIHNALDQDNIIRKIQVHFLSFIIFFCNDLIQTIFPDLNIGRSQASSLLFNNKKIFVFGGYNK